MHLIFIPAFYSSKTRRIEIEMSRSRGEKPGWTGKLPAIHADFIFPFSITVLPWMWVWLDIIYQDVLSCRYLFTIFLPQIFLILFNFYKELCDPLRVKKNFFCKFHWFNKLVTQICLLLRFGESLKCWLTGKVMCKTIIVSNKMSLAKSP